MSTRATAPPPVPPVRSVPAWDPYRFGADRSPELQPGTMGWSVADVEDPRVSDLWHRGRFEIHNGVLVVMPPAYYYGGACAMNLVFAVRDYLKGRRIPCGFSSETDIRVRDDQVVRADAVAIFGDDLPKFRALRFPPPRTDWRGHVLTLPPTLVIESVSQGHEVHDRQTKRRWYADLGVPCYWIVDGFAQTLDCARLADGQYADDGAGRGNDVVRVGSLNGLSIPLADVWADADRG